MGRVKSHIASNKAKYGFALGLFPSLFLVNLSMPTEMKFATANELLILTKIVYASECSNIKSEWYRVMEMLESYRVRGEEAPQWLVDKKTDLELRAAEFGCPM